ncbi:recombinase family protein [Burkholderia ubonensis]|uniref:recombinase family protein n=1 Tax=Burkholderia ubonensis TaxID=101571 RepID=UPI0008FDD185|nr:recombinase family protein [Burkholderia ubonensis]
MKLGYARVSTDAQDLALQIDALTAAGCQRIFRDQGISGSEFQRPGLDAVLAELSPNDTLVVWRLDRLGRSLGKLVALIGDLGHRQINFQSLSELIDTNSAGGMLVFHMMAALAEFEQRLISERTRAGIAAALARGGRIGRKPALTQEQGALALKMLNDMPIRDVAIAFGVHPRTLKRLCAQCVPVVGVVQQGPGAATEGPVERAP